LPAQRDETSNLGHRGTPHPLLNARRSSDLKGGVETTMERRSAHEGQEHIPPGLIRMSVGCEDVEDLWRDLDAALRQ
jgi:hypothetical protein